MVYDLLVIGAGPGGYTAAIRAAKHGLRTAVIERGKAGGTCVNRGCVPTKALLHAAGICRAARTGAPGIQADSVRVDPAELYASVEALTERISGSVEEQLFGAGAGLIRGTAAITAPGRVSVVSPDGSRTEYSAENILLATGAEAVLPEIPGIHLPGVITSDEFLSDSSVLSGPLFVLGGGVIGVELAQAAADLGVPVTLAEVRDTLLPGADPELGKTMAQNLKKHGVQVLISAEIREITEAEQGLLIRGSVRGREKEYTAARLLCAAGRRSRISGLFAGWPEPATEHGRLRVNAHFETSIPHIYAIGDLVSRHMLAHEAEAQGTALADWLISGRECAPASVIPSVVYTDPEAAFVGMTPEEAADAGIAAEWGASSFLGNARAAAEAPGRCYLRLTARRDTHELLGASILCPHAGEMISGVTQAMEANLIAEEMLRIVRPHPSYNEAMHEALENLCEKLRK